MRVRAKLGMRLDTREKHSCIIPHNPADLAESDVESQTDDFARLRFGAAPCVRISKCTGLLVNELVFVSRSGADLCWRHNRALIGNSGS